MLNLKAYKSSKYNTICTTRTIKCTTSDLSLTDKSKLITSWHKYHFYLQSPDHNEVFTMQPYFKQLSS